MSIWTWALEAYARPGVAEACEVLQDAHGQNVSFLLWAVWSETAEAEALAGAASLARNWESLAVAPLRAVRRELKAVAPGIDDGAREALRENVRAAELDAERVLLESLAAQRPRDAGAPALVALKAASAAWGRSAPDEALAMLAAALD